MEKKQLLQGLRVVALPFSSISADHDEIIATCFPIHLKGEGLSARTRVFVRVFKQLPFVVAFRRFFFLKTRDERERKIVKGALSF